MIKKGYPVGNTFREAFVYFEIKNEKTIDKVLRIFKDDGYTEKGICYGLGKGRDKIAKFIGDERLVGVCVNEVRKYAKLPDTW